MTRVAEFLEQQIEMQIPPVLKEAQRENRLIIFAGAGVSYAPQACLPDYEDALRVAWEKCARSPLRPFEELERPLNIAKLFDDLISICGPRPREIVRRLYSSSEADNPTTSFLQHVVVRLFGANQKTKIITTNYDRLLGVAAKRENGLRPEEYSYPNLTMRRESITLQHARPIEEVASLGTGAFNGIVHIHGSVAGNTKDLVIGFRDFEKAYLGNEVLPKFLRDAFSNHHIMFIGYGLSDPFIEDIVKIACPDGNAYACCTEAEEQSWSDRGVYPVAYDLRDAEDRHVLLLKAIAAWADEIRPSRFKGCAVNCHPDA